MFFPFFDNLYSMWDVYQAFQMICTNKMLSDGYIDMNVYIGGRIKKNEMYAELAAQKSRYAVLYQGSYPTQEQAYSEWISKIPHPENTWEDELTSLEASAIVNWVYRSLKNAQERIDFTQKLFHMIKELHGIQTNFRYSRGVIYNAAKVDLHFFSSVSGISSFISSLKKPADASVFYRGHANPNYLLRPSIMRTPGLRANENMLYQQLLINCPEDFERCHTHLEKLVKMQHYGLPTRLLDITRNLLVALFFACESHPETFGELVLISANRQDIKYPQSDTVSVLASLPVFSAVKQNEFYKLASNPLISSSQFNTDIARLIHEVRLEKPAFQPEINKDDVLNSRIVYALKNNNRIIKQDGAFILCGLDNQNGFLEKFRYKQNGKKVIVLLDKKKKILEQLESFSINRASLFPEIECVSEYLKNQYM